LEENLWSKTKRMTALDNTVRWYVNTYVEDVDLHNKEVADIIIQLQKIKEVIIHNKRIFEDASLSNYVDIVVAYKDVIGKQRNQRFVINVLCSLEEKYRATEYREEKLFIRKQVEKCFSCLPLCQKKDRKKRFDYENIIKPAIRQL
jgi:hypothetical protein